jgi:hypothetical protein
MQAYQLTNGTLIFRTVDGTIIPADPANRDYQDYQSWLAAGNTPDPAPIIVKSTTISTYEYFNRFTPAETNAIHEMALVNPPNTSSLLLFNYLMLAAANGSVTLDSPTVISGHAMLVQLGLLTPDRSAIILTP